MNELAIQRREAGTPAGTGRLQAFPAKNLRAQAVKRDGRDVIQVDGYATVYERLYDMWDMFGPYSEGVRAGAATATLAASPDVAFLVNHKGVTMARTSSGSLELSEDASGLAVVAYLNPGRMDVSDLVHAIDDRDVTEMSFAFRIDGGEWSPDFTEFWITGFDLDRGDVSAVNYGANPYTSIAARAGGVLADLEHLPLGAARAAQERLTARLGTQTEDTPPSGRSVALLRALLDANR